MSLKFTGGFAPPQGRIKISKSIPQSFWNGLTTKEFSYTPKLVNLSMDTGFSKWMTWDGTTSVVASYDHTTTSINLPMDTALSKWMTTWVES